MAMFNSYVKLPEAISAGYIFIFVGKTLLLWFPDPYQSSQGRAAPAAKAAQHLLKCRDGVSKSGWWYTYPSEKYEFVSWDDEIPKIWKHEKCSKPPISVFVFAKHIKMWWIYD